MANYLVPGPIPEDVQRHFIGSGLRVETTSITQPFQAEGYLVSGEEIQCSTFQELSGITLEQIANARSTNRRGIVVITLGDDSSESIFGPANGQYYTARYQGSSERVQELLNKLAQAHKVDIVCRQPNEDTCFSSTKEYPHCRSCELEFRIDDEYVLTIHFNCSNLGRKDNLKLTKLYEFALGGGPARQVAKSPLSTSRSGEIVLDTNGTVVAEVAEGSIYILVNLEGHEHGYTNYYDEVDRYWRNNAIVLERILSEAIPIALKQRKIANLPPRYQREVERRRQALQAKTEESIAAFISNTDLGQERQMEQLSEEIRENQRSSNSYLERYVESEEKIRTLQATLNTLRQNPHSQTEAMRTELANILSMPDVIGIDFDGYLEVYTDTIYIEYRKNRYRIGSFKITIGRRDITIRNLSKEDSGLDHPHVRDQYPCWGNVSQAVAEMLKEQRLEMLITVIIQFLKSYEPGGAYGDVQSWPKAA